MNRYSNTIKINNTVIGEGFPTYFIADIAANHDGDINRAIKLIKLAEECGANAVKFQHFNAETIVSDYGFKNLGKKIFESFTKSLISFLINATSAF